MQRFHRGDWDDAAAAATTCLTLGEETGTHPAAPSARAVLAAIAVHRDELATALAELDAARAMLDATGPQWGVWWLVRAEALLQEAEGDTHGATQTLGTLWEGSESAGDARAQLFVGADLVRLASKARGGTLP